MIMKHSQFDAVGAVLFVALGAWSSGCGGGKAKGQDGGTMPTSCRNSLDCSPAMVCDPSIAQCVECVTANDCPANNDCIARTCVPFTTCTNSLDCPKTAVCNTATSRCVACLMDADCADATKTCVSNACRTKCDSDRTCTPLGMLCDLTRGACAQCLVSLDCGSGRYCQAGSCLTAVCTPGQTACMLNGIATCNSVGDGYSGAAVPCDPMTCQMGATGAKCVSAVPDGGAGHGGASGSSGGAGGSTGTGGASAALRIISVDFVGGRTLGSIPPMDPTEIAGARPASHWNSAQGGMGTLAALVFSDGVASGASVTWSPPMQAGDTGTYSVGYTDVPGDVRMMNGFLGPPFAAIPAAGATMLTVDGLPASIASGSYDVYVYVLGSPSSMRSYQYAIGNTAFTVVQAQSSGSPMQPGTPYPYVLAPEMGMGTHIIFRGVTGASFALTVKPVGGSTTSPRAPVNGFQIVSPSGS